MYRVVNGRKLSGTSLLNVR
jgi:Ca2+-binding EF-hand superfamily protein